MSRWQCVRDRRSALFHTGRSRIIAIPEARHADEPQEHLHGVAAPVGRHRLLEAGEKIRGYRLVRVVDR